MLTETKIRRIYPWQVWNALSKGENVIVADNVSMTHYQLLELKFKTVKFYIDEANKESDENMEKHNGFEDRYFFYVREIHPVVKEYDPADDLPFGKVEIDVENTESEVEV